MEETMLNMIKQLLVENEKLKEELKHEVANLKKEISQIENISKANCPLIPEEERKNAFLAYQEEEVRKQQPHNLESFFK